MSDRELVVLGTASQVPTRHRNHNGYLLRWDGDAIVFDPGEGTQRQFTLAGVSAASVSRICISHFHGDHCLGLPGLLLRIAVDGGTPPVTVHYPLAGQAHFVHLRYATAGQEHVPVDAAPVGEAADVHVNDRWTLRAAPLRHRVPAVGWRLQEPDGRRMLPDRLADAGVHGPAVGRLQRDGRVVVAGRTVLLDDVSEHRRGQVFSFVMDTAWCDAAVELAHGADLLVCESTFLDVDAGLAELYGHLTARQAGRLAAQAGARRLVLTHFSRRYGDDATPFADEAATEFDGDVVVAEDLMRVAVPPRR